MFQADKHLQEITLPVIKILKAHLFCTYINCVRTKKKLHTVKSYTVFWFAITGAMYKFSTAFKFIIIVRHTALSLSHSLVVSLETTCAKRNVERVCCSHSVVLSCPILTRDHHHIACLHPK